ncbi:MAG: arsenosugar biosynthesis radical SAM protein ArsS [Acidobacteriota bacterium]|nr:arsenosugar biosynthesis radical SAM protein ArsS [Acidobacteriota bacterium]
MPETLTCCQESCFANRLQSEGASLLRGEIRTVQLNLGRLCNQVCRHCHMQAGPTRTEVMDMNVMRHALEVVRLESVTTVDLTGGAPEMNPHFRWLVAQIKAAGRRILVRTNLTVLLEPGFEDLPAFFANHGVEVISSLPCYTEGNVDAQRGNGVFKRSIEALRRLNANSYGRQGSGLSLTLVYNPGGPSLPGPQAALEADYKAQLLQNYGIVFDRLLTITNTPIGRFAEDLQHMNKLDSYRKLLDLSFNPATLANVMCREMLNVAWDGTLYDCDFNQALGRPIGGDTPLKLGALPVWETAKRLRQRQVVIGDHCFSCTAGAGSSCQGALQS